MLGSGPGGGHCLLIIDSGSRSSPWGSHSLLTVQMSDQFFDACSDLFVIPGMAMVPKLVLEPGGMFPLEPTMVAGTTQKGAELVFQKGLLLVGLKKGKLRKCTNLGAKRDRSCKVKNRSLKGTSPTQARSWEPKANQKSKNQDNHFS